MSCTWKKSRKREKKVEKEKKKCEEKIPYVFWGKLNYKKKNLYEKCSSTIAIKCNLNFSSSLSKVDAVLLIVIAISLHKHRKSSCFFFTFSVFRNFHSKFFFPLTPLLSFLWKCDNSFYHFHRKEERKGARGSEREIASESEWRIKIPEQLNCVNWNANVFLILIFLFFYHLVPGWLVCVCVCEMRFGCSFR